MFPRLSEFYLKLPEMNLKRFWRDIPYIGEPPGGMDEE
jgi:hypothetical protein